MINIEDKCTLINGDCLVEMLNIPDKSIDLIICDLPYGLTSNKLDITIPFDKLWEQYNRIIKDDGNILLFGQGLFFIDLVNSNRSQYRYDIVWDKELVTGFLNARKMPLRSHEQIAVFYKKHGTYNPQMTKGKPLHGKGNSYKQKVHVNNNYGDFKQLDDERKGSTDKYPVSIFKYKKSHPSIAMHRTEKPVGLLELLIKTYSNEGDLVLDNCFGSGTSGLAAIDCNRKYIGIEIDENYFKPATVRIINVYYNGVGI